MKDRDIRAFRQLDVYRIVLAEVAVVLGEPSAEATRFGANNGITTGIVADGRSKTSSPIRYSLTLSPSPARALPTTKLKKRVWRGALAKRGELRIL